MNATKQIPGCLPEGFGPDSMLTVEQFAIWRQEKAAAVRKRLMIMAGVDRTNRKAVRIHPRTFLDKTIGAAILIFTLSVTSQQAAPFGGQHRMTPLPDRVAGKAILALYGETCGQPLAVKVATACAERNRIAKQHGSLRGICGRYSPLLKRPLDARQLAECRAAWQASAKRDVTNGATHWGTPEDIATGVFTGLKQTAKVGPHTFYK